ncbi:hypothetical protein ACHAXS_013838 [Conticribra weissflogii]
MMQNIRNTGGQEGSRINFTSLASLWLILVSTEAWRSNNFPALPRLHWQLQLTSSENSVIKPISYRRDVTVSPLVMNYSRRKFLSRTSNLIASTFLSNILFPAPSHAEEEEVSSQIMQQEISEKEIIKDILSEEKDEKVAIRDTKTLIDELNRKMKGEEEEAKGGKRGSDVEESTKTLINDIEKEEERIKSETENLITEIEALGPTLQPQTETQVREFVDKLKTQVEEKEDIIARLKRESEKDLDPKTGKFKVMSKEEFNERAPSDFDFVKFLKDTVLNEEEYERDLEAFEGLLGSKFGPLLKELDKDFSEIRTTAGPLIEDVRKASDPYIGDALDAVKTAGENVVDNIIHPPFRAF